MAPNFESELAIGIGTLTGGVLGLKVKEKDDQGNYQDALIIRTDREWQVTVNWALRGSMLDLHWLDIRGKWVLNAYLEGLGKNAQETDHNGDTIGGIAVEPPPTIVKVGIPPQTQWEYVETFTFAPKAVKTGAYKLVVTITYEHDPANPGPMAGFIEFGNMIQLYDPGD